MKSLSFIFFFIIELTFVLSNEISSNIKVEYVRFNKVHVTYENKTKSFSQLEWSGISNNVKEYFKEYTVPMVPVDDRIKIYKTFFSTRFYYHDIELKSAKELWNVVNENPKANQRMDEYEFISSVTPWMLLIGIAGMLIPDQNINQLGQGLSLVSGYYFFTNGDRLERAAKQYNYKDTSEMY